MTGTEPGQIVTITRAPGGTFTFIPRPGRPRRYTYVAWMDRVIDGVTLIATV